MNASHARIRELAHALWMKKGCTHGHALDDWLEAERLLAGELESFEPPSKVTGPAEGEVGNVAPEVPKVAARDAPGG